MTIMMTMVTLTIVTSTMAIMVFLAMVTTDHGTVYCLYFLWQFFSLRTDKAILGSRMMTMMMVMAMMMMMLMMICAQTVRRGG